VPDDPQHEPIKNEPVVVGDIVDLVVVLAGTAGVMIPDDVAAKVVAAVAAVIVWLQSTYFKRRSVTPETRAQERETAAYEDGVAAGQLTAAPTATVVQVPADHHAVDTEWERALPRLEPAPDPIPWAPTRAKPPAGLDG
jgi:hypothetical protein